LKFLSDVLCVEIIGTRGLWTIVMLVILLCIKRSFLCSQNQWCADVTSTMFERLLLIKE